MSICFLPYVHDHVRDIWMVLPADVWEKPTTLGTVTEDWLLETVSLTMVVDLTEFPPAGLCLSTVPAGAAKSSRQAISGRKRWARPSPSGPRKKA